MSSEEAFWDLRYETIRDVKWLIVLDPLTSEPLAVHPSVGHQLTYEDLAKDVVPESWFKHPCSRRIGLKLYPYGSVAKSFIEKQRAYSNERRKVGAVYFMQAGEGFPIKIGFSTNPTERLKALQYANGHLLKIIALIEDVRVSREREIHKQFAADRLHGEWFRPSEELLTYVRERRHHIG